MDFPQSYADLLAWFRSDEDALDYLEWLRWGEWGFVCPACEADCGWRLRPGLWSCQLCSRRVSVTAGTIFDRTRTPLTVWFTAAWMMTASKQGVSAAELRRQVGFGSYQTAWAMLHRYRSVMADPARRRLTGTVEVDETLVGGTDEAGKGGRSHDSRKALVVVAVEQTQPKGLGRCRLEVVEDASTKTLAGFLARHVEPGSVVITDGWRPYRKAVSGYIHDERAVAPSGKEAHELLPGAHRVASLLKRWIEGTHQGSCGDAHLQAYLEEFTFRFNRRRSKTRGLLFYRLLAQAVTGGPVRYHDLVSDGRKKKGAADPANRTGGGVGPSGRSRRREAVADAPAADGARRLSSRRLGSHPHATMVSVQPFSTDRKEGCEQT